MTTFSNPVELLPTYPPAGTASQCFVSSIHDDVAVALWSMSSDIDLAGAYNSYYLSAIRHTPEGPVVGPTLLITPPTYGGSYYLNGIVQGRDGEAWIALEENYGGYYQVGRVTVDPTSLAASVEWKFSWRYYNANQGAVLVGWPEENLLVLATNNGDYTRATGEDYRCIIFMDMDTGAVTYKGFPPYYYQGQSTNTTRVKTVAISINKAAGKVLFVGDWYDLSKSRYEPSIWIADITPAGIGDWLYVGSLRPAGITYYFIQARWAAVAPTPDGWTVLFMHSYYSAVNLCTVGLDGSLAISDFVTTSAYNGTSLYYPMADADYDASRDRAVMVYRDRYYTSSGFAVVEAPSGSLEYDKQILPKSEVTMTNEYGLQSCMTSPGNYVITALVSGVAQPREGSYYGSHAMLAWAGGQAMDLSGVTDGQVGSEDEAIPVGFSGPVDRTRRSFRRMH